MYDIKYIIFQIIDWNNYFNALNMIWYCCDLGVFWRESHFQFFSIVQPITHLFIYFKDYPYSGTLSPLGITKLCSITAFVGLHWQIKIDIYICERTHIKYLLSWWRNSAVWMMLRRKLYERSWIGNRSNMPLSDFLGDFFFIFF